MRKYSTKVRPKPRKANPKSCSSTSGAKGLGCSTLPAPWLQTLLSLGGCSTPCLSSPRAYLSHLWHFQHPEVCTATQASRSQLHITASQGLPGEIPPPCNAWLRWLSKTVEEEPITLCSGTLMSPKPVSVPCDDTAQGATSLA